MGTTNEHVDMSNKTMGELIMIEFDFTPHGVCSRNIHVAVSDDAQTVEHIEFTGGCNGNLKAIRFSRSSIFLLATPAVRAQRLVPTK